MAWRETLSDVTPRVDNRISTGHMISLAVILLSGAVAWGSQQADNRALTQRVSDGEKRDEKTADTLDQVKGSIIELKSDNKGIRSEIERQGRQLDRIEQLLRDDPPPRKDRMQ